MRVGEIMTSRVDYVSPSTPLVDVAREMGRLDVGAIPVVDDSGLRGIVTDRDIVVRAVAKGLDLNSTPVMDIMTTPVITVTADTDVRDAAQLMKDRQIRRLPVVSDDGSLVGIISLGDVAVDTAGAERALACEALTAISQPAEPRYGLGS